MSNFYFGIYHFEFLDFSCKNFKTCMEKFYSQMAKKVTKQSGISSQLPLAMRSGKFAVGFKRTISNIVKNKAQCVIVAANMPEDMRRLLEYYCVLSKNTPMKFYEGSNNELSVLAGLKFRTSVITILDQGEADLVGRVE